MVGGGPAGLSGALVLGRVRRRVLLLDTESPANAASYAIHGFLSRDGTPPREVRRVAREQLRPYDTVEYRRLPRVPLAACPRVAFELAWRTALRWRPGGCFAHGMRYALPDLPGVGDVCGQHVFHCPYCHGWEVRDRAIAVYGGGDRAVRQALPLVSLSDDVVLLTDGDADLPAEQSERLAAAGVALVNSRVERIRGAWQRLAHCLHRPRSARAAYAINAELTIEDAAPSAVRARASHG